MRRRNKKPAYLTSVFSFGLLTALFIGGQETWAQSIHLPNMGPQTHSVTAQVTQQIPVQRAPATPIPLPPKRALIIVVEENQSQFNSVTWLGLSQAIQRISPVDLLPQSIRTTVQSISNTVDPLIRNLHIPNVSGLMDVVKGEIRILMLQMFSAWIVNIKNQLALPGSSSALPLLNTLIVQGPALGKDPYKVFVDHVGETGLGNTLRSMALPYYNRVDLLTDQSATFSALRQRLIQLHQEGYKIDLLIDVHGCGKPITMNNRICNDVGLKFAYGAATPDDIRNLKNMNGGRPINLNAVYMVSCWGGSTDRESNFLGAWLDAGAKAVNGPYQLNYFVLLSPIAFLDQFTRRGRTLMEAAQVAYNAERTLLNGATHNVVLNLRPFFDRYLPPSYVNLNPCLGVKVKVGEVEVQVGYQMIRDYAGNTDYCVTQQEIPGVPKTQPTSCPVGHTKTVRRGNDLCKAPDLIAAACGGSRDGCRWTFNLGVEYSRLSNPALGRIYGETTSQPVNNAASSARRHAGDPNLKK